MAINHTGAASTPVRVMPCYYVNKLVPDSGEPARGWEWPVAAWRRAVPKL